MQAFADRAALSETLQTGLATFYSRSRGGRWCKGETSGNFIKVRPQRFKPCKLSRPYTRLETAIDSNMW